MSATEDLAFTRNFEPGGTLDKLQPDPWRRAMHDRVGRAISTMQAERDPGLDDFHASGQDGLMTAGPDALKAVAEAVIRVDREDSERVYGKARTAAEWADLVCTPAWENARRWVLLRLGGKWLHHGLPGLMVLGELLKHNRTMCIPPLPVPEVELLWRSLCDKHATERRP
jgi:hypothetical protein